MFNFRYPPTLHHHKQLRSLCNQNWQQICCIATFICCIARIFVILQGQFMTAFINSIADYSFGLFFLISTVRETKNCLKN